MYAMVMAEKTASFPVHHLVEYAKVHTKILAFSLKKGIIDIVILHKKSTSIEVL